MEINQYDIEIILMGGNNALNKFKQLQAENERLKNKVLELDHELNNVLCENERYRKALENITLSGNNMKDIAKQALKGVE